MHAKPPPIRVAPTVIKRERLFKLVEDARLSSSCLWVSGIAGSGKTTLIADYLRERPIRSIWYQLGRSDSDLPSFFFRFGNQLNLSSGRKHRDLPLFSPEFIPDLEGFSGAYFGDLFRKVKGPFFLVFDNHQELSADSGFDIILVSALRNAPQGVTVVVISRSDPPPIMTQMAARQQLTRIGTEELAFSKAETRELALKLAKKDLDEDETVAIHKLTRGWAAGIILLMLLPDHANRWREQDADFAPREIFDFFGSEVFAKLEKDEQDFLVKTALFPSVTVDIASGLTGKAEAKNILNSLLKRNFFIERRAQPKLAYIYHPLFRDFLLSIFDRYTGSEADSLRQRAADLLLESGRLDDAVPLYARAKEWCKLITMLLQQAPQMVMHGRFKVLLDWINQVPQDQFQGEPWLLYWKAVCTVVLNPEHGIDLCRQAYRIFRENGELEGALLSLSAIIDAHIFVRKSFRELEGWISEGEKCIPAINEKLSSDATGKLIASMLAATGLTAPGHISVPQWEALAEQMMSRAPVAPSSMAMTSWLMYLDCYRGNIGSVQHYLNIIGPCIEKGSSWPSLLTWKLQKCIYFMTLGDANNGILCAKEGLKVAHQHEIHVHDFIFWGHLAYFYLIRNDIATAHEYLGRITDILRPNAITEVSYYYFLNLLEACQSEDWGRAKRISVKALETTVQCGLNWPLLNLYLLLVGVHRHNGDQKEASAFLHKSLNTARETQCAWALAACSLINADCQLDNNQAEQAVASLSEALTIWDRIGILYHPAVEKRSITRLCAYALKTGIRPEVALKAISHLKLVPKLEYPIGPEWPWPLKVLTLDGHFSVLVNGKPIQFSHKAQRRPLELLQILSWSGPNGQTRSRIADRLWPEAEGDRSDHALSSTLTRLRNLLQGIPAIVSQHERIALSRECCWVDAWHFESLLRQADATDDPIKKKNLLSEAVNLFKGDISASNAEVESYSREVKRKLNRALYTLADLYQVAGDLEEAAECFRRGVVLFPDEEKIYCALIKVLITQGNRTEASKVYSLCRQNLSDLLGVEPSEYTIHLYRSIWKEQKVIP